MGIPVDRYLVPDAPPVVPNDFVTVSHALVRGIPEELRLDADYSLLVYAPTGNAVLWRDAEATLVVVSGDSASLADSPAAAADDVAARVPVRLVLRRAGIFVAAVPLAVGLRRRLPDDGSAGSAIELLLLDYRVHAGSLRGPGDFGSLLRFAWKRIDRADDLFILPPLPARVAERFVGQVQSQLGLDANKESDDVR
jgi:hypothetical protein